MTPRSLLPLLLLAACGAPRVVLRLEPDDGRPGPPLVLVLSAAEQAGPDVTVLRVTLENRSLEPVEIVRPLVLEVLGERGQVVATALDADEGAEAVLLAAPEGSRDPARAARISGEALRGTVPPGEARTGLVVLRGTARGRWIALSIRHGRGELRVLGRLGP